MLDNLKLNAMLEEYMLNAEPEELIKNPHVLKLVEASKPLAENEIMFDEKEHYKKALKLCQKWIRNECGCEDDFCEWCEGKEKKIREILEGEVSGMLKCEDCGYVGDSVEETICPYAQDVDNEEIAVTLCPGCIGERRDDI